MIKKLSFTLFFFSAYLGAMNCRLAWKAISQFNPIHPILTVKEIAERTSRANKEKRKGDLVSLAGIVDRLHITVVPSDHKLKVTNVYKVGERRWCVEDEKGRSYLVEAEPAEYQTLSLSLETKKLKAERHPFKGKEVAIRDISNAFKEQAYTLAFRILIKQEFGVLAIGRSNLELNRILNSLSEEFKKELIQGIPFSFGRSPSLEDFPLGLQGVLSLSVVDGKEVLLVEVHTPYQKVKIANELGDQVAVVEAIWKKISADFPVAKDSDDSIKKKGEYIAAMVETRKRKSQGFYDTLTFAPKLLYYPWALTYKAARRFVMGDQNKGIRVRQVWFRFIQRDGLAIAGYLFLVFTKKHPNYLFIPAADEKGSMLVREFRSETQSIFGNIEEGTTLVADLIPQDDVLGKYGAFDFQRIYGKVKSAYYFSANSVKDFWSKLEVFKNTHGEADRFEIYSHGNRLAKQAALEVGNDLLTLDADATFKAIEHNRNILNAILKKEGITLPPPKRPERTRENIVAVSSLEDKFNLFKAGALLRLISCSIAKGQWGENFVRPFGTKLFDKGGKVISATVNLGVAFEDMSPEMKEEALKEIENDRKKFEEWKNSRTSFDEVKDFFLSSFTEQMIMLSPISTGSLILWNASRSREEKEDFIKVVDIPSRTK